MNQKPKTGEPCPKSQFSDQNPQQLRKSFLDTDTCVGEAAPVTSGKGLPEGRFRDRIEAL